MRVDHGLRRFSSHDRCEGGIAEEFAFIVGHHADAVGLQRVERVFDLAKRALDIRQRHRAEQAEAARILGDEARAEVVGLTRQRAAAS